MMYKVGHVMGSLTVMYVFLSYKMRSEGDMLRLT